MAESLGDVVLPRPPEGLQSVSAMCTQPSLNDKFSMKFGAPLLNWATLAGNNYKHIFLDCFWKKVEFYRTPLEEDKYKLFEPGTLLLPHVLSPLGDFNAYN